MSPRDQNRRAVRLALICLATVFVAVQVVAMPSASAATKPSKVDAARATARQIKAELARVTAALQAQEAQSASANQASAAARSRLRAARAEEASVGHRLDAVRASAKGVAVRSYMKGDAAPVASATALDPSTRARSDYLRDSVVGSAVDIADGLAALRQDLIAKRQAAEAAAHVASDRQRAAADAVNALRASQSRQLKLAGVAESRVREADAAARIKAPRASRGGGGVRVSGSLATTHGITVASSIAGQLDRMLNAADAAGAHFGGTGYRSSSGQVAARRKNCGSSSYDVYEKSPGSCHPPTARPGTSMHERGLAIDFTYNGSLIQGHGNAGYQWLSSHAASYGFYNLPSEAWHWSVNGN